MSMRESWIDRWKGLLILLVVLGHVVGAGGNLAHGETVTALLGIRSFIYLFHMPAFFILAGLCFNTTRINDEHFGNFILKRSKRLLLPYFAFGVFSWGVYDVMFNEFGSFGLQMIRMVIAYDDFRCNSVLWFLPTMFLVVSFAFVSVKLIRSKVLLITAAVLAFLAFFLLRYNHINQLPFMLFKVFQYYFFFMVGIGLKRFRNVSVNAGSLLIAVVVFIGYIVFCECTNVDTRPFAGFMLWMFKGVLGSVLTALIVKGLPARGFKWLEWIGGMSMGIMLIHKFPLVAVQEHIPAVRKLFCTDAGSAFIGVIIVFAVSLGISIIGTLILRRFIPWTIGER